MKIKSSVRYQFNGDRLAPQKGTMRPSGGDSPPPLCPRFQIPHRGRGIDIPPRPFQRRTSASPASADPFRGTVAAAEGDPGRGKYEETQARVFIAALPHTARLGWTESALIAGARDVGVSPAIVGSIPRKDAALVEVIKSRFASPIIDQRDELKNELKDLTLSDRLTKLIRIRLEMQAPYIAKWPQALSIQAQPANLPNNFKQRAELIDEIWHAAGDSGSDFDWYLKRTILGGIYSTTEVYMLTDHSPDFRDTWVFLDRRVKDAFDLQKTVQEAAYLAEAVGAGVGNTVKGFMAGIFPGSK
ncbi:hypothetical protein ZIOFF_029620 [Zingiber officinale]|uniref:Ubiquinone biosynthesis protein n=1 Tax=Zingiber officinale TaxID=94328 RepID=A0A8J5GRV3_ZINOF|nr:hypothetical protein ZIOFF_029620 [Zingiber officinale]